LKIDKSSLIVFGCFISVWTGAPDHTNTGAGGDDQLIY